MPIDKALADRLGIDTLETENKLLKEQESRIEAIKDLLPSIINGDNRLNVEKLEELIGLSNTTYKQQGYELTFAGKALANSQADSNPEYELNLEIDQSKQLESTKNIIIRGDNLDALKILKQNYSEKIKMIYIDPPYNTGNDDFIYNDNFKENEASLIEKFHLDEDSINYLSDVYKTKTHSGWLCFMYPRLKLARELLKEDGVIFVSIDDNEQANLKILMDEIFGSDNFVMSFIRKTVSNRAMAKYSNIQHEYILCYAKSINNIYLQGKEKDFTRFANPDNDSNGDWAVSDPSRVGGYIYEIKNPYTGSIDVPPIGRGWNFKKENIDNLIESGKLVFKKEHKTTERSFFIKIYLKDIRSDYSLVSSLDVCDNNFMNQVATKELNSLFNNSLFTFPKPTKLLHYLSQISTNSNDIVLDFFAGSGTTGQAVMDLNKEDGGNRKYILVQLDEKIKDKQALKFCKDYYLKPVISSITIERVNRAGDKLLKDLEEASKQQDMLEEQTKDLDIGYKVFSLQKKQEEGMFVNVYNIEIEIVYNMMVKLGISLHEKIKTISKSVYVVSNNYYVVSEITAEDKELIENIKDSYIYINGFANIKLEDFLNLLHGSITSQENIKIIY